MRVGETHLLRELRAAAAEMKTAAQKYPDNPRCIDRLWIERDAKARAMAAALKYMEVKNATH